MSLLVRYTLNDADGHAAQTSSMKDLVSGLVSEGVTGVSYSCFSTDNPVEFIGILEFDDDAGKDAFLQSAAFAAYREKVGPTFANPPQTTEIAAIASTRG